ncbi:hypothetical protein McanMca71_006647 [Microsporum canis]|uniref:Phospholipase/Carboxylesterase n=1 Tax=Arthroderma otae (strain ATCC MYA-4605 / CBS 113480) TaxID=554155 RepID=C5FIH4_ARTOC|nr:phospholipase/Carboxylesterase [Microsporum canis CBS 113480]EEQ29243.1 phospholipase/Carboxylesterase [Microsporum canis CBS 113480]
MPPVPKQADFPSSLTVTITPPDTLRSTNILILLHGLGDTPAPFANFASGLHLPETSCITVQAPVPLPFDLPGFHWGDDIVFEADLLDPDPGFSRATRLIVTDLIRSTLIDKLGYKAREILLFGFAQGASAALSAALEFHRSESGQGELGGIIAVGGVLPLSAINGRGGGRNKSPSPVLVLGGHGAHSAVSDIGARRTKEEFEYVEIVRWRGKKEDTMPRNREEMMPIMQFFARRLRSTSGVPEGSVELTQI